MTIRKLRAGRVSQAQAETWVGPVGMIFYNELTGTLRISDGVTPGGNPLTLVAEDFQFTFGDFVALANTQSTIGANQDFNIESNGTGAINLVGKLEVHTTAQGLLGGSVFSVDENGFTRINTPSVGVGQSGLLVTAGGGVPTPPQVNGVVLHLVGADGITSRIVHDVFGTGAYTSYIGRHGRGTLATPAPTQAGDLMTRVGSLGWGTTNYAVSPLLGQPTSIDMVATETYSDTKCGSQIEFYTTPNGTLARTLSAVITPSGVTATTFTGNATTASQLATPRTITLVGDVTGVGTFDGSANINISTTTIQTDSVALGTDTTGNYVATVVTSGIGISAAGSGTENAAVTITSNATSANTASTLVARDASGNFAAGTVTAAALSVTGTSTLQGNITATSSQVINISPTAGALTINPTAASTMNNLSITLPAGTATVPPLKFTSGANLTTPQAGVINYDGTIFHATPIGQQRGIILVEQYLVINADRNLNFVTTAQQPLFATNPTISANTRYYFRLKAFVGRTTGDNNTALTLAFGGTAVLTRVGYAVQSRAGALGVVGTGNTYDNVVTSNFATPITITGVANPPSAQSFLITGLVDVGGTGGTFIPTFSWSGATPAGASTVAAPSTFHIYPIGPTGVDTSVGQWV